MRRTLALAGAAILAAGLGGLASGGSASADHGVAHNVEASEVAVDLDTDFQGSGLEGTFVELQNNTGSSQPLDGYEVWGCTASTDFQIIAFGPSHDIDPDDQFLIADPSNYSGPRSAEASFANPARGLLNQDDGGIRLIDPVGTVNGVKWGMPSQDTACAGLPTAKDGASPTDTHSLNYDTSIDVWCAAPANPHEPSPSCAS